MIISEIILIVSTLYNNFKNLNAATNNQYQWPIPDIKEMLHRVGESRPHFFAVFDLTSGYYQAPISEESRKYTAFRARNGIYRWKRLPMGLTGAGSYFQHSLVTQVLQDLMRNGVELYLDDCMVHADSIESFIDRLRLVFHRFRNAGIVVWRHGFHSTLTVIRVFSIFIGYRYAYYLYLFLYY